MSEEPASYIVNNKDSMDGKSLKLLYQNRGVKQVKLIAQGRYIFVQFKLKNDQWFSLKTNRGSTKQWCTFDATIKWLGKIGIYHCSVDLSGWNSKQEYFEFD